MITVKNLTTGEIIKNGKISIKGGEIVGDYLFGKRFFNKYGVAFSLAEERDGHSILTLNEGWDILKASKIRTTTTEAPEAHEAPEAPEAHEAPEAPEAHEAPKATADKAMAEAIATIVAMANTGGLSRSEVEAIATATASKVVTEAMAEKCEAYSIKVVGEKGESNKVSHPHPLLKKVLTLVKNDRAIGRSVWLHGPAGSGKSTIAKQVAEAMGLPFYSVSSLQQKYELEGYTDASGELVKTSFYEAAKHGGIFLFDEASTTSGEVQVAFNNMLANLVYNFPKDGMVTAHPDFHIIAADNTTGRGGNDTYSSRFKMDESTLDRYNFVKVDYTEAQEKFMATGDDELIEFAHDVRKACEASLLTYLATPRFLKAAKALEACEMPLDDVLITSLFGGWDRQDAITVINNLSKGGRWLEAAKKAIKKL